jgi:hypothetical protein
MLNCIIARQATPNMWADADVSLNANIALMPHLRKRPRQSVI